MASGARRRYHRRMIHAPQYEALAIALAASVFASMAGAAIAIFVAIQSTQGAKAKTRV
jgi:uncharacterized membrane protein